MTIDRGELARQGAFILMLLGIVFGAWYFLFLPRDLEDRQMRLAIVAKQRQLQKINRATATIGNLKDEIANLDKAIQFFQSKLPNEKEMDKVLEEVWRLAEANDLTTKGIYATKSNGVSPFVPAGATQIEQPIKMEFEGDFMGFYGFLLALEAQPRIMRIREIKIEPGIGDIRDSSDVRKGLIKASLMMSVFFENQPNRKGAT